MFLRSLYNSLLYVPEISVCFSTLCSWDICIFFYPMFLRSLYISLNSVPKISVYFPTRCSWDLFIFTYSMFLYERSAYLYTLCILYCYIHFLMFLRFMCGSLLYVPDISVYFSTLCSWDSSVYNSTLCSWELCLYLYTMEEGLRILSPVCACSHAEPWGACITFKDLPSTGSSKNMRHYWQIKSIIVFNQRGMHL